MNEGNKSETSCCSSNTSLRTEYEGSMECKMKELGAKIDEFSAKACSAKDHAKEQAETKMLELNVKREQATKHMKEMKEASGEAWTEFKGGLDKAFEELKQAWEELRGGSEKAAEKLSSH